MEITFSPSGASCLQLRLGFRVPPVAGDLRERSADNVERRRMKRLAYTVVLVLLAGGAWHAADNYRLKRPVSAAK